jgi:hypothetical protein
MGDFPLIPQTPESFTQRVGQSGYWRIGPTGKSQFLASVAETPQLAG